MKTISFRRKPVDSALGKRIRERRLQERREDVEREIAERGWDGETADIAMRSALAAVESRSHTFSMGELSQELDRYLAECEQAGMDRRTALKPLIARTEEWVNR